MIILRFLSIFLFFFGTLVLAGQNPAVPRPRFVPVVIDAHTKRPISTLASFEFTSVLGLELDSDFAADFRNLDSSIALFLKKLAQFSPHRATHLQQRWEQWRLHFPMWSNLIFPPGLHWETWARPKNSELAAVAVYSPSMNPDEEAGAIYLNQELYEALSPLEQTRVVLELLLSTQIQSEDHLETRTLENYILSKAWSQITPKQAWNTLGRFSFEFFEYQNHCFKNLKETVFNSLGVIIRAEASPKCKILFYGQPLQMHSRIDFFDNGDLSRFHMEFWNPLYINLYGRKTRLQSGLDPITLYPDGSIAKAVFYENEKFQISTGKFELDIDPRGEVHFFPDGGLKSIDSGKGRGLIQNQLLTFQDSRILPNVGIHFHEDGSVKCAEFSKGARLLNEKRKYYTTTYKLEQLCFTKDGWVIPPHYKEGR